MPSNRTLAIVKPDAFASARTGLILAHFEKAGFTIVAARVMRLTHAQAGEFYAVHRGRPFYAELVEFMTSGACMPIVLDNTPPVVEIRTPASGALVAEDRILVAGSLN